MPEISTYNPRMRRPPHVEKAHEVLLDWATWQATHPHGLSLLDKLTANWEAIPGDRPSKSLVPTDLPPVRIGKADAAIRDPETPAQHRETIVVYYLGEPEDRRRVSRLRHACALEFLAGLLR